jgi:hypothetical protein
MPLWDDVTIFFGGIKSDYEHLKMEEKGISKMVYEWVLERLKGGS